MVPKDLSLESGYKDFIIPERGSGLICMRIWPRSQRAELGKRSNVSNPYKASSQIFLSFCGRLLRVSLLSV